MSGTRANLITCPGMITHGNELTRAQGSLRKAKNVNIDEDGVITPRRGFNDFGDPTGGVPTNSNFVKQLIEYKSRIIRHYSDKLEFESPEGTFNEVNGSYTEVRSGYRIKWQESNSNMYFTTDEGIKKISVRTSSDVNADMVTQAGGLKAGYAFGNIVPTTGGFLPPQAKVAYRVIFGTRDANNNLILGSPSSRFVVSNLSQSVITSEQSSITMNNAGDAIADGDNIILNTLNNKYCVYFDATGGATEPQTADTIGATYVKVNVQGNTTNEATSSAILANVLAASIPEITVTVDTGTGVVTITHDEDGDIANISGPKDSTGADIVSGRLTTSTVAEGQVNEGSFANVRVTGVIPEGATTDYFYQVYRTGFIEVTEGLTINDIDPGDECNLVYESGLTDAEITAGQFEVVDNTPESFRASNVPLYTNEITGEGILQANEEPPIALDIALFRNSMFYANTKSKHRLDFSILSIDDFVSGSTRFIIGNSNIVRQYTFVGTAEKVELTVDSTPSAGDYVELSSASNERKYYMYFGDSGDDPDVEGAVGIRISLDGSPTNTELAERIVSAFDSNIDFDVANVGSTVTYTYTNNGYTDGIVNVVGSSLTINTTVNGTGELSGTDEGGDVLLSGLVSVGQSIDETARSLVKVISQDLESPVNAFYLSTSDDLPGQILLESRSLEDINFYIAVDEPSFVDIGGEFSPELPVAKDIEEFTGTNTTTEIQLTGHGYNTGDQVFVGYFKDPTQPSDPDSFSGVYEITVIDVDNFSIPVATPNTVVSFVPSYSAIFLPNVESDNQEAANRLYYSKANEPEAVPIVNFINVGPQDEEIKRILALRDNLFVLKDDGIYIVSGTSAPNFSVRLLDNTRIIAPDSAVVLNNQIYCLTEQGVTIVTDSGAGVISRNIENLIDRVTNQDFDFSPNTFGVAYENDRSYIMFCPSDDSDTSATQAFRYNVFERTWTRWEYEATCGLVLERNSKLYVGNGDRNYISEERKNNDRTDHADRDFDNAINTRGVLDNLLEISTLEDVELGDVITQTQEVTINYLNRRLLVKMDNFDTGITPPASSTMLDSFGAIPGDNMVSKMQDLNDYLVTLDPANITVKVITIANLRQSTEDLVDELNLVGTITTLKDYVKPETVEYEAYITSKDVLRNQITVHEARPFLEGVIKVFKHIDKEIEWNPQHFGDPSALKQIRYITIMFDQNNFYDAIAKFATDVSQAVTEVKFQGKGIGYWGDMPWSSPNDYWGGEGNDIPFRNPVPRGKQKCRYISLTFAHENSREYFRIVGISAVVRAISDRAYR